MIIIIEYKLISFLFDGQDRGGEGLGRPARHAFIGHRRMPRCGVMLQSSDHRQRWGRSSREDQDAASREPVADSSAHHFRMTGALSRRSAGRRCLQRRLTASFCLVAVQRRAGNKKPRFRGVSYSSADSRSDVSIFCLMRKRCLIPFSSFDFSRSDHRSCDSAFF